MVRLTGVLATRLRRLRYLREVELSSRAAPTRLADRRLAFVAIEADNLWKELARLFVLSCARGAETLTGTQVRSPRLGKLSIGEVLTELANLHGPPATWGKKLTKVPGWSQEPNWRDISVVYDCCISLGVVNVASVKSALRLLPSFQRDLKCARNFAAHRNAGTASELRRLGIRVGAGGVSLVSVLRAPGRSPTPTIAAQWLDEIERVAIAMLA